MAEEVSESGVDFTVQVVGLQVSRRAREQLRCIAEEGGGIDRDADDLARELNALVVRELSAPPREQRHR